MIPIHIPWQKVYALSLHTEKVFSEIVPAHSLTHSFKAFYSSSPNECELNTLEINELEAKIDELIQLCTDLEGKITVMQMDKENWAAEKSRLLEKNDLARNKVEAMIMRLKALEQD